MAVYSNNFPIISYAYEPFPESFALFQENMALNQAHNVQAFPCAIGAKNGRLFLQTVSEAAVQHSTAQDTAKYQANTIEVQGITLDHTFKELGLQRCDFVKIDCEGAEYEILFALSKETLYRIKHICLEYHEGVTPYSHSDLVRFLKEKGFFVRTHPNPAHRHIGFLYASNPHLDD